MEALDKLELRALSAVAAGANRVDDGKDGEAILTDGSTERLGVRLTTLMRLSRRSLLARRGGTLAVTPEGSAALRRALDPGQPFLAQHLDLETVHVEGAPALLDVSESPLAQLMRRRGRDGGAFLDRREFDAGERLRADFTRGQLMPRLGANWERPISSGRSTGAASDLSDGAVSARIRVDRAVEAVGPELSGVLIDVCCFLKGLETVERERGWPVRSAKLMLKSALGALARHYEPAREPRTGRPAVLSWGGEGYRPTIGG